MKSKANLKTSRTGGGFSAIELIITATILTVVTGFGILGINRAKASIRLSGAAREYAAYIERARILSIRSHADDASERSTIAINDNKTSYDITMDLDNDGDLDTRTITLPSGIEFDGEPETIAFDWRGRTWNTQADGSTEPNAQVSIRLKNGIETISIDVTGSGDITINSAVFDDDVPNVTLNVGDLASNGTTTTTTTPTTTTTTSPLETPVNPTPPVTVDPLPDTNPDPIDTVPGSDPTTNPNPSTSPSPTATPTPSPSPSPSTQQPPSVCTVNADMATLNLNLEGSGTIKVSHNASVSLAISATSSKPSELQVSGGQTVSPGSFATFTIKSKKSLGLYNVTFKTSCGEKVVSVLVAPAITLGL